jgi:peptide/nickel transport system permease protein
VSKAWRYRISEIKRLFYRFRKSPISVIGLGILSFVVVAGLFANYIAPYPEDISEPHFADRFQPPSWEHIFGTDRLGRDLFSRVLFGIRISLLFSTVIIAIAVSIGTVLGLLSGYVGSILDAIVMRMSDLMMSVPPILLAILITTILTPSLENSMIAVAVTWWPSYARLVRGEVLRIKEEGFVEAAKAFGAGPLHVVFREILPNLVSPLSVKVTMDMGYVMLVQAALGFLGLGARPPTPELGVEASWGRQWIPTMWWLTFFPGLFIFLSVLSFSLVGDGIRDALVGD